jgi:hypothetical protein
MPGSTDKHGIKFRSLFNAGRDIQKFTFFVAISSLLALETQRGCIAFVLDEARHLDKGADEC